MTYHMLQLYPGRAQEGHVGCRGQTQPRKTKPKILISRGSNHLPRILLSRKLNYLVVKSHDLCVMPFLHGVLHVTRRCRHHRGTARETRREESAFRGLCYMVPLSLRAGQQSDVLLRQNWSPVTSVDESVIPIRRHRRPPHTHYRLPSLRRAVPAHHRTRQRNQPVGQEDMLDVITATN